MKEITKSFIITGLLILFILLLHQVSGAESWKKVVDRGFGNTANDYAWSMATFQGNLYVGTLNSLNGAEIWSSSTGEPRDWNRVYKAPTYSSWGVRCLYADGDQALYACVFNILGAMILRTENGRKWTTVARGGLGNRDNYTIRCMTRFGDYLYAGSGSSTAQLFRSANGFDWEQVMTNPDFGSTKVNDRLTGNPVINNALIGEMQVFNDQLYAFTWTTDFNIQGIRNGDLNQNNMQNAHSNSSLNIQGVRRASLNVPALPIDSESYNLDPWEFLFPTPGAFEVWRSYDGVNWEKVVGQDDAYGNGMGFSLCDSDSKDLDNDAVTSTAIFKGQLYLGTECSTGNSSVWRTSDGTKWEKSLDFFSLGEKENHYVWRMIPFGNKLYIGTFNSGLRVQPKVTGAQIWASNSGDPGTFYNLVHNGFDGSNSPTSLGSIPKNYGIRSFGIVRGKLFAGTATVLSIMELNPITGVDIMGQTVGCEIWQLVQ